MSDLTVVYYTSNRENESFEDRIRKSLSLHAGDCPIISVSQKPVELGTNICVGDIGFSAGNAFRQLLIGFEAAKTKYVCTAESDFLYPPEFFLFRPPGPGLYFASHMYVLFAYDRRKSSFRPKSHAEGAMIADRDYAIDRLRKFLEVGDPLAGTNYLKFHTEIPLITFKTGRGLSLKCPHSEVRESRAEVLPFWGSARNMRREYRT